MFKLIILAGSIYLLYRWYGVPSIGGPKKEEEAEDYTDYEEID